MMLPMQLAMCIGTHLLYYIILYYIILYYIILYYNVSSLLFVPDPGICAAQGLSFQSQAGAEPGSFSRTQSLGGIPYFSLAPRPTN